jgi:predicted nucleic acid-binding protein
MKVVVDSNIVFSAILNSKSRIGQILTIGSRYFEFYSINLLKTEILNHRLKIQNISGYSKIQFEESFTIITSKIRFVSEILLSNKDIETALKLTRDIDENDTLFVALANHLKAKLWTGDKKLEYGLKKKEFQRILSTDDMYHVFMSEEFKKGKR